MSGPNVIKHRRGDTFSRAGTWSIDSSPVDLTDYTIECLFYTRVGRELLASVPGTPDPDQVTRRGVFTYSVDTGDWEPRVDVAHFIRFTAPGGSRLSSPSVQLEIEEDYP